MAGEVLVKIAERFGASPMTIATILEEQGIPRRRDTRRDLYPNIYDVDGIVAAYTDFWTLENIASEFGIAVGTVKSVLTYAGLKIRSTSETIALRRESALDSETIVVKLEAGLGSVAVKVSDSIQEMRAANLTINHIADIKGLTAIEVMDALGMKNV